MKYVVLTAKHCDGFCLWHSKASGYNISKTPFVRDVCAELAKAAQTAGIRIGWYYSPMDWRDPDCRTERNAKYVLSMQEQLRELLSNYGRIDLLWFDTDGRPAPWDQKKTYGLVKQLQPHIVINNRLDMGGTADYDAQQIGPNADYYTPEQRIGGFDDQPAVGNVHDLGHAVVVEAQRRHKVPQRMPAHPYQMRRRRREPVAERRPDA